MMDMRKLIFLLQLKVPFFDGVDVISISIAMANTTVFYDPISVVSFAAMNEGILVSYSQYIFHLKGLYLYKLKLLNIDNSTSHQH